MKFTLGWLKNHLETGALLPEIAEKLTALGFEVEGVEDRAATFAPFKVAYVEKAEKHPDADRLKVCIVDTGTEKLQVVCGAPNARAGMKGVFAPAGSFIPGTGITLKKSSIRGQESNGMLVSEREMGLSDEHNGIIEIAADVPLGTPMAGLFGLDDPVIEIALTPNRADGAGVRGIARDLAAAELGKLKPLDKTPVKGSFKSPIGVTLKLPADAADACPLFLGRYIKGVKNGPSPKWLQDRLKAVGLRPISALVDITNYISYDLCRPLHVFDADKLSGNIHVRLAKKGETLNALNGKDYTLDDFMTAVCDDAGVLALAGVIGGTDSGCTDGTVNAYIECAYFDPNRTARTGRALAIDSDARYRFERGIDPAFTVPAMEIATRLILDICGGSAGETVTAGAVPPARPAIVYDPGFVAKLAGFDVPVAAQKKILASLGFIITEKGDAWSVQPPAWRGDIMGKADLVEEIVRVTGYDKIPATSMTRTGMTRNAETISAARARRSRSTLASRGLNECVTWSFISAARAQLFGSNDNQAAAALRLVNPISADLDCMRPSLLPNLIDAAVKNQARGLPDSALFEVGPAFLSAKNSGQHLMAAGLRCGNKGQKHWSGADASRPADLYDVKADILAVLESCGLAASAVQISRDAPAWYHPGRSAVFRLGPNIVAQGGDIHPATLESLGAKENMSGFEIFLDRIPQARRKGGTALPLLALSPFQPVARDFAFIVDQGVEGEAILRAVRAVDKTLIAAADIFDVYQGKGVPEGKKSVAVTVTLQPTQQTLTDAEIESAAKAIIDSVAAKTGSVLRG